MSDDHYDKQYSGRIDVYRICRLYDISDPAIYHAIKKLLRFGDGNKDKIEEVSGALASLRRWLEMEEEDSMPEEMRKLIDEISNEDESQGK